MKLMFNYGTFTEVGCTASTDCPHQKACINSLCVDPCAYHECQPNQECQINNHRPICINIGKRFQNIKSIPLWITFDIPIVIARNPSDCSHCSGGACDPITGACVKGNFSFSYEETNYH